MIENDWLVFHLRQAEEVAQSVGGEGGREVAWGKGEQNTFFFLVYF